MLFKIIFKYKYLFTNLLKTYKNIVINKSEKEKSIIH